MNQFKVGERYRVDLVDDHDFGKTVLINEINDSTAYYNAGITNGWFHINSVFANNLTKLEDTMIPEPSLDPPEDGKYITAGCGHEVYEGETVVYWKDTKGKTVSLCPECFRDKVSEMSVPELAEQFSCEYQTIGEY